eukprot:scaffold64_cov338-Pavlova_lutheri.AAC.55
MQTIIHIQRGIVLACGASIQPQVTLPRAPGTRGSGTIIALEPLADGLAFVPSSYRLHLNPPMSSTSFISDPTRTGASVCGVAKFYIPCVHQVGRSNKHNKRVLEDHPCIPSLDVKTQHWGQRRPRSRTARKKGEELA